MNIPNLDRFEALIFDLDGTLIDSMPLHNQAWIETIAEHGHEIKEKTLYELAGVTTPKTVEIFNERFGWNLDPRKISEEKEAKYLKKLETVRLAKEVMEVARDQYGKKALAIVTGGHRETVQRVLGQHDIAKYFSVVVCAEDTEKGKRCPDPFLLAAQKLDVAPAKCLVFEDGDVGIQGAEAAGMSVVKVDLRRGWGFA